LPELVSNVSRLNFEAIGCIANHWPIDIRKFRKPFEDEAQYGNVCHGELINVRDGAFTA
jgi:hypothetical protein